MDLPGGGGGTPGASQCGPPFRPFPKGFALANHITGHSVPAEPLSQVCLLSLFQ